MMIKAPDTPTAATAVKPEKADSQERTVPQHLGIILDGNRRWAKARGLPVIEGHRQGAETFRQTITSAFKGGVKYLSAYVFSTENWSRTQEEVSFLMGLLIKAVEKDLEKIHQEGIRVVIIGSRENLDPKVDAALNKVEATTKDNTLATLALCFNYGGKQEIVDAVKALIREGVTAEQVTPELISQQLYHPEVPELDMIIRTSGEQRLSNFMLWRSSYAELRFVDKFWPDFADEDLQSAFTEYSSRQRRYGK